MAKYMMAMERKVSLWILFILSAKVCAVPTYSESLSLSQSASDNFIIARFNFMHRIDSTSKSHHDIFPRAIDDIIKKFEIAKLELQFTQGRWLYDKWRYSSSSAPSGLRLWTLINGTNKADADAKWKGLTHTLSGLYCASINFLDESITFDPSFAFNNSGLINSSQYHLRQGLLAREGVCTENLTPWTKMLPCKSKAGIGSLLNTYRLSDANYYSLGIEIDSICKDADCDIKKLIFSQKLTVVFDPHRIAQTKSFSLKSLFKESINGHCPLAHSSVLQITLPHSSTAFSFISQPDNTVFHESGGLTGTFNLNRNTSLDFNAGVEWQTKDITAYRSESMVPLRVHRYQTGFGQERGGIRVDFENSESIPITITYYESVQWRLKVYSHTIGIKTISGNGDAQIEKFSFLAAVDRVRPCLIELQIRLPANSFSTLSYDFDKSFLRYHEHPPDSARGFDLGSATIIIHNSTYPPHESPQLKDANSPVVIFTENLLIDLATPDFSMPYNVITFTCTVLAYFFGSLFNVLTRKFEPVRDKESEEAKLKEE